MLASISAGAAARQLLKISICGCSMDGNNCSGKRHIAIAPANITNTLSTSTAAGYCTLILVMLMDELLGRSRLCDAGLFQGGNPRVCRGDPRGSPASLFSDYVKQSA
jgi:hypothetical protein